MPQFPSRAARKAASRTPRAGEDPGGEGRGAVTRAARAGSPGFPPPRSLAARDGGAGARARSPPCRLPPGARARSAAGGESGPGALRGRRGGNSSGRRRGNRGGSRRPGSGAGEGAGRTPSLAATPASNAAGGLRSPRGDHRLDSPMPPPGCSDKRIGAARRAGGRPGCCPGARPWRHGNGRPSPAGCGGPGAGRAGLGTCGRDSWGDFGRSPWRGPSPARPGFSPRFALAVPASFLIPSLITPFPTPLECRFQRERGIGLSH